ncbi:RNA 2',3'-cyclic phosphodiesterase [Thermovibrio sp.]
MKKRLFVGVFTPFDFSFLKEEVDSLGVEGKWVEEENLHLTFRFLGQVQEDRISLICRSLSLKLKLARPLSLEYVGLGTFKKSGLDRVLWVGVKGEGIDLIKLRVDEALAPFGFLPEKDFKPHITLLRIKRLRRRGKFSQLIFKMREHTFGRKFINKVCLIESKLSQSGPTYTVLEEFKVG